MAMQPWFAEAKLGIFIHWGIYAVNGIPESWSFYHGEISHEDYMRQLDGFTASRFDPEAWAQLFVRAGARYAVLTSKHHDGVALYDTSANDLSVVRRTPAARDLVREYADAMRAAGLKVGLYYSHLDWTHPDYASVRPVHGPTQGAQTENRFAYPAPGDEDPAAWERFVAFQRAQIREVQERFAPDLLWFDGDWERDPEQWGMAELHRQIHERQPNVVVNGRMQGGFGDYATPEQAVPVVPPEGPWELCLTINDSWGWQTRDDNYKSVRQLVRIFAETIGGGGNLLLDVGPREDGTIPAEQVERLEALGSWIGAHTEAVFGTERGLPAGHFYGASTLSRDGRTLYLFAFDPPAEYICVRGLGTAVKSARIVGSGAPLRHQRIGGLAENAGWQYVSVEPEHIDPLCTVIALELDGELDLRRIHTRD